MSATVPDYFTRKSGLVILNTSCISSLFAEGGAYNFVTAYSDKENRKFVNVYAQPVGSFAKGVKIFVAVPTCFQFKKLISPEHGRTQVKVNVNIEGLINEDLAAFRQWCDDIDPIVQRGFQTFLDNSNGKAEKPVLLKTRDRNNLTMNVAKGFDFSNLELFNSFDGTKAVPVISFEFFWYMKNSNNSSISVGPSFALSGTPVYFETFKAAAAKKRKQEALENVVDSAEAKLLCED